MAPRWLTRSIRPPDDIVPNDTDPLTEGAPGTVGPDQLVTPGDPHGVVLEDSPAAPPSPPSRILPSAWSGWPESWWTPSWSGRLSQLTDTAWACVDKNVRALETMPPYLVGAAATLDAEWLKNPDPELYTGWDEAIGSLFWDYFVAGEAFVLATAWYSTGWPARWHVVPPWMVTAEMDGGRRSYRIGEMPVTSGIGGELYHLRYRSTVDNAHGVGPLEAGRARLVAADVLARYGTSLASAGGIPASVLEHPEELSADQAGALREQWVLARQSALGEPAVLSGGIQWKPTQMNPRDMALLELLQFNESKIAILLGVPPHMMGLPSGGDSMTYANVTAIYEDHWRSGLRPPAHKVMQGLSEWLLPRGTTVELNEDAYIRPSALERAQTYEILNRIKDDDGNPVLSVRQIEQAERFTDATPTAEVIR